MSLVNDLLIELDRQTENPPENSSGLLDGVAPNPRRPSPWRRRSVQGIAAVGLLGVAVLAGFLFSPRDVDSARTMTPPPAVSASPKTLTPPPLDEPLLTEKPPIPIPAFASTRDNQIERAPTLRSVSLEKRDSFVRIRLEADGALAHRLEHRDGDRDLILFLESATLSAPIDALDLTNTPIRSISTRSDRQGLRLTLRLDERLRINSQSLQTREGTTLFLDLQSDRPRDVAENVIERVPARVSERVPEKAPEKIPATRTRRPERVAMREHRLSDSRSHPTDAARAASVADEIPSRAWSTNSTPSRPANATKESGISRSAGDRDRLDRNSARQRAASELAAGRFARSEADFEAADLHYRTANEILPNHRETIIEWASLLAEMSRTNDAIALIRTARRANAKDPALAMFHAHLLESSEHREEAIALLDRAGFSLTEAPDVHALAAAYLQRQGQHALAIHRYESIVRRYPGKSQWWMGLGISLEAESRRAEAADVYRIAMQIGDLPSKTRQWVGGRIEALEQED